jgi:myo-inositol-hexaphosphate 3-phosphohydrolase
MTTFETTSDPLHGTKLFVFCFLAFSMSFGAFLGQGGKNLEKTKNNNKIVPWRGSEVVSNVVMGQNL